MTIHLTLQELSDIKRAIIIAMQLLDSTGTPQDVALGNRLEAIEIRLNALDS